ncbi:alpha/beta fold hydrolase [Beijerinckia sp. L45]|uniref:alpha/beta fold hydrolase n=1 Tax=Beijerinckia sp. L45 TaxID=1641855 RepID=UPI00131AF8A1|nr:alpha/beta hydrolase [Beijerinckia sp. L45]
MKRLYALLGLTSALVVSTPIAVSAKTIRNVVLVHGAFVDASSWDKVAALLRKRGFNVTAVHNPLTSLGADVAATRKVLAAQDGPTVLVGHSWGGVVIGEAGDDPKVKALVYVGAFALDKGESVGALIDGIPPTEGLKVLVDPTAPGVADVPAPESDVVAQAKLKALLASAKAVSVNQTAFPRVFAGDVSVAEAEAMAKTQMPLSVKAVMDTASVAAWRTKPTYYVVHANDLMIPPEAEAAFAQKIKATTITIPSSHASPVSHPKEIAAFIEQAACEQGSFAGP